MTYKEATRLAKEEIEAERLRIEAGEGEKAHSEYLEVAALNGGKV